MSAYASRSSKFGPYAGHIDGGGYSAFDVDVGDRLGGPVRRRRGRTFVRLLVLALVAGAAAWTWINHRPLVEDWTAYAVATVGPMLERKAPEASLSSRPQPQESAMLPPLESRDTPPATAVPTTATLAAPAEEPGEAEAKDDDAAGPVEKLPPAVADPADPYQVRALAAGLHPGLSRALLSRLSDVDYRNAEHAIKTALAETPDGKVFEYPKKRSAELALFQVKFVRGIAADCRRYVVMVTKDRWLTTAMPMEKCGIKMKPEKQARR
ncbi:MAG: hypothetical protein NW223_16335 [Hyphomicrobiaceae bacterium]|nr:hypothetical protein [Hyphomicrobiaceae bacterium]